MCIRAYDCMLVCVCTLYTLVCRRKCECKRLSNCNNSNCEDDKSRLYLQLFIHIPTYNHRHVYTCTPTYGHTWVGEQKLLSFTWLRQNRIELLTTSQIAKELLQHAKKDDNGFWKVAMTKTMEETFMQ